jgi:hypothetical protein
MDENLRKKRKKKKKEKKKKKKKKKDQCNITITLTHQEILYRGTAIVSRWGRASRVIARFWRGVLPETAALLAWPLATRELCRQSNEV